MSLSVRTRFEVFKRDRFTCSYCGGHPPDVLLECDHILPRAAGGTDEITNLTTSCRDCNAGKSDRLLEEGAAPVINQAHVDDLRERLEQAAAYTALVGGHRDLVEKQAQMVIEAWAKAFHAKLIEDKDGAYWHLDYGRFPDPASVRQFVSRIPVQEVLAAIDITASRFNDPTESVCRFFYKVCWRRIKGESGPIDGGHQTSVDVDDLRGYIEHLEERLAEYTVAVQSRDELLTASFTTESQLRDQLGEKDELIADLQRTIRRFREETGRE